MKQARFAVISSMLVVLLSATAAMGQRAQLVTINRDGTDSGYVPPGGVSHHWTQVSEDGRYVVFDGGRDLVYNPPDARGVFVRDTVAGVTALASINRTGTGGGSGSSGGFFKYISADGRYAAFSSTATDLVDVPTNGRNNAFVRDVREGRTMLASINRTRTAGGNADSSPRGISADGRFIYFVSSASDLVDNDTNGEGDLFAYNTQTGTVTLVGVNYMGTAAGNRGSGAGGSDSNSTIASPDGRYVVFGSASTDLTEDAGQLLLPLGNLFVRDMQEGRTVLISPNTFSDPGPYRSARAASISSNGRYVVFQSDAYLVPEAAGGVNVYVRDLQESRTILVSLNRTGTRSGDTGVSLTPTISADGRYVAFTSNSTDLVVGRDTSGLNVFVRDVAAGTTTLASVTSGDTQLGSATNYFPPISRDGRFVAFQTSAYNIYIRDLVARTTTLASVNFAGSGPGNGPSTNVALSADGRSVSFSSLASNLVERDTNQNTDVFLYRLAPSVSSIEITSPGEGIVFQAGATITATVAATLAEGAIQRVEFYANDTLVGSDDTAPYSLTATSVPAGTYVVRARAVGQSETVDSRPVTIFVNAPPEVEITSPADGATFDAGATITATAAATDVDGVVTMVEFFANGFFVGRVTTAPYELTATNVPAGTYVLTARALDNRGGTAVSRPVTITVR